MCKHFGAQIVHQIHKQSQGEHGSELRLLGIQSRHESSSGKRRPSPHYVSMRWTSRGDSKLSLAAA